MAPIVHLCSAHELTRERLVGEFFLQCPRLFSLLQPEDHFWFVNTKPCEPEIIKDLDQTAYTSQFLTNSDLGKLTGDADPDIFWLYL